MPEYELNERKRRWILTALMLAMMLAAMDATIVSTAIPQIVADLGGFSEFSWVFSIYLLAQTVTIPVYGKLADQYGRKPVLITGTIIFLTGSAASAGAWNMLSLILFRCLQGLGAGSIMATVNTLAGDLYSLKERAKVQGWLSGVWGLAAIVGPAIGGALAGYASWRWIFLINVPIGIVALALIIYFLQEKFERHRPQIDFAGSVLVLLTVGIMIFGLLEGGEAWPWISIPSLIILIVIIALAIGTLLVERKAKEPIIPGWLWNKRVMLGANLSMVGMGLVMMGPETYLPTFAQAALGLGAIAAGFILASMSIGWPAASALSGKLYLRTGFRNTSLIGATLVIIACIGFLTLPWPQSITLLVIDQVIMGAGFGLLSTSMLVGIQSAVSWEQRGVVTGSNMFFRYLGQSLGAAIIGAIFNNALKAELKDAPVPIPGNHHDIINLLHSSRLPADAVHFLRSAVNNATHHIYIGLLVFSIITFMVIFIAPGHFPIHDKR